MNEQRRDFFKNSALSLVSITLGAGLAMIPNAQAQNHESPNNGKSAGNLSNVYRKLKRNLLPPPMYRNPSNAIIRPK